MSISLEEDFSEIVRRLMAGDSLDYAASRGEYLNARVMAEYLGFPFIDAEQLIFFSGDSCDFKKTEEVAEIFPRYLFGSPVLPLFLPCLSECCRVTSLQFVP